MTHRQFLAWQAWQTAEHNRPSRDNWYQMVVACEVRRVLADKPNNIQPDHFKLKFQERAAEAARPSPEDRMALSKAAWFAGVGGKVRVRNPDGTLTEWKGDIP